MSNTKYTVDQRLQKVEVLPPKGRLPAYAVHMINTRIRSLKYTKRYREILKERRAIDHGEFNLCVEKLVKLSFENDLGVNRREALYLQCCRNGGKTFMATAVASLLEQYFQDNDQAPFVIFISMSNDSSLQNHETALSAILSRVAFEIHNPHDPYSQFIKQYSNFDAILYWLQDSKVILLIDDLDIIDPNREEYNEMGQLLDSLGCRSGCSLLYTTRHKIESDLLGDNDQTCARHHYWQPMPRVNNRNCIRSMNIKKDFWATVLRGRIPALVALESQYLKNIMPVEQLEPDMRQLMFNSILSGSIENLEGAKNDFRSHAYLIKNKFNETTYAWPPFLCAQESVLGKNCKHLCNIFESPQTNKTKAFKALVELAVILRLMSSTPRNEEILPQHYKVTEENSFHATAIFEIESKVQTISDLQIKVESQLKNERKLHTNVWQIIVIPLYSEFSAYDFFLFHRVQGTLGRKRFKCKLVAGYHCKMGGKYSDNRHVTSPSVSKSFWIDCKSPLTKNELKTHGWIVLDREDTKELLGASFCAALPEGRGEKDKCEYCNIKRKGELERA